MHQQAVQMALISLGYPFVLTCCNNVLQPALLGSEFETLLSTRLDSKDCGISFSHPVQLLNGTKDSFVERICVSLVPLLCLFSFLFGSHKSISNESS